MPRKPDGDVAMTSTERVHRWRERHGKVGQTDRQKLNQARAEIERLRELLSSTKGIGTVYQALERAWLKDHPGRTVADYKRWSDQMMRGTAAQRQQWSDWVEAVGARHEAATKAAPASALVWQSSGSAHRAQRGGWTYFIHRDAGRQFTVAISKGHSLPDRLDEMPSLEQAKAHCAEHAARIGVTDADEIARLSQLVSELQAAKPKPAAPPLDSDDEAARKIRTLQRKIGSGPWQAFKNKIVMALTETHTTPAKRLAALQAWNALGVTGGKRRR